MFKSITLQERLRFQSTLPAREATPTCSKIPTSYWIFQSTLPAREATDWINVFLRGDTLFQSTLPAREATLLFANETLPIAISIHASREGSDYQYGGHNNIYPYFNPRFPRGKRRHYAHPPFLNRLFQSTLPAREATSMREFTRPTTQLFQSTLPAREATYR